MRYLVEVESTEQGGKKGIKRYNGGNDREAKWPRKSKSTPGVFSEYTRAMRSVALFI